jgi:hypothetical protein
MKKILLGIKRHWKRFIISLFFGYVTLWALLEPLFAIIDLKFDEYNWIYFIGYLLISLIIATINVWPKNKIKLELKNTNTKIEIVFGDLFKQEGSKVISVNNYFDTEIGKPVSSKSLHGYFIEKIIGGHTEPIENAITEQLQNIKPKKLVKSEGKTKKYPLGTTIYIDHSSNRYFLFAFSKSDRECKAYSSPANMLNSLDSLWDYVRNNGNGHSINLSLIGNGLSGVGLPPTQLIQLILISILKFTKSKELSTTIRIVLTKEIFSKVDLELIKNNWN